MTMQSTLEIDQPVAPEDQVRANMYSMLGRLMLQAPNTETMKNLVELDGGSSDVGSAVSSLAQIASALDVASVEREFNTLFIGVGRGEILPYASYYLTGFLHEKPLADLRANMRSLGVARKEGIPEPEDHLGSLCEVMAGLITGVFGDPAKIQTQKEFFNAHIGPWAAHCFSDLEKSESAVLYAPVGSLGSLLIEIERESFRIE